MPNLQKYKVSTLHSSGWISVSETASIYYEQYGNPQGPSVVYNHGGPGGFSQPDNSQWFDPDYYNIIIYDQRGTGKSKPSVMEANTEPKQFSGLTIMDMVEDLEVLRKFLGISQWLLFGGSWGSTLSLSYALKYPKQVTGLILYGIFLNQPLEMNQYYDIDVIKERFPELGETALKILFNYACLQGKNDALNSPEQLIEAYYQLCVEQNDVIAQYLWTSFEWFNDDPSLKAVETMQQIPLILDPSIRTHAVFESLLFREAYDGFNLLDEKLLYRLKDIDIRIVQGNSDTEAPPIFAEKLVNVLKKLNANVCYQLIEGKHSAESSTAMTTALLECTNSFKQVITSDIQCEKSSLIKLSLFSPVPPLKYMDTKSQAPGAVPPSLE
ncbi:alpha/beta fold hydrolase [Legionella rowbothamii]|uniref:alpha/beta fold hydrolase n=1 Tax=Legionella rowbothamii TaxID=96229 RepID=UPI0013EF94A7|nr:alpha/beta fold hydrolase [Legionella rowbothamii]